jgi:hypothetical protein
VGIDALVEAWKRSDLCANMITEMTTLDKDSSNSNIIKNSNGSNNDGNSDDFELNQIYDGFSSKKTEKIIEWWDEHNESYPSNYYYLLYYCLDRQIKLTYRDITYIKGSIVRTVIIASIAASLFNNLPTEEYNSMTGIIYFSCMQNAVSGLSKFS